MSTPGDLHGFTLEELRQLRGAAVYTIDGEQFGHVGEIWYDENTHEARYLKVGRGPAGLRAAFVPVPGATEYLNGIRVPYTEEQLDGSPDFDEDEWTDDRERDVLSYYLRYRRDEEPTSEPGFSAAAADAPLSRAGADEASDPGQPRRRLRRWEDDEGRL